MSKVHARGPKPARLTVGRVGLYCFLTVASLFFLLPLYTMVVTSLKTMAEIRVGNLFALPSELTWSAWQTAWSGACMGTVCVGIRSGFWNSVSITVPAFALSF